MKPSWSPWILRLERRSWEHLGEKTGGWTPSKLTERHMQILTLMIPKLKTGDIHDRRTILDLLVIFQQRNPIHGKFSVQSALYHHCPRFVQLDTAEMLSFSWPKPVHDLSDLLLFARITCSQLSQKCMQKYICRPNLGKPECRERLIVGLAENAVAADRS